MFNKKFILLVSFTAALGRLFFGFDTAIISGAIPYITSFFHLNEFSLGWAVSVILIGYGMGLYLPVRWLKNVGAVLYS